MNSSQIYKFRGKMNWVKYLTPDTKFDKNGVYGMDFYLDVSSLRLYKRSGLRLQERQNEEGVFVKFTRKDKKVIKNGLKENGSYEVAFSEGHPPGTLIGNGSEGWITIRAYETIKGKGHEIVSLLVTKLISYDPAEVFEPEDLPAGDSESPVASSPQRTKINVDEIPF